MKNGEVTRYINKFDKCLLPQQGKYRY